MVQATGWACRIIPVQKQGLVSHTDVAKALKRPSHLFLNASRASAVSM